MMSIVYTVLAAIAGLALVIIADAGITKIFSEKSLFQKNYIKMPLSYFIGILALLLILRMIFR